METPGGSPAKKESGSDERRRQINRESARRIRARKLAEVDCMRQKNMELESKMLDLYAQIHALRNENAGLLKQNLRLTQQNVMISEDLHTCIANNDRMQTMLGTQAQASCATVSGPYTEEVIPTPRSVMPPRSAANRANLPDQYPIASPFGPLSEDFASLDFASPLPAFQPGLSDEIAYGSRTYLPLQDVGLLAE